LDVYAFFFPGFLEMHRSALKPFAKSKKHTVAV
jgi:hypothetical protein